MVDQWSAWKKFPMSQRGEHLDAPVGPGVYELRSATSGNLIAFGHSPNVAAALSRELQPSVWDRWLRRQRIDVRDVEYRTMGAASARVARDHAANIDRRREVLWGRIAVRH